MADLPAKYDLTIYQGDDWERNMTVKDNLGARVSLTGATLLAQVRKDKADVSPTKVFTIVVATQSGGTIGDFNISLTSADTTALTASPYVWDLQITWSGGKKKTYLAGDMVVTSEVTR